MAAFSRGCCELIVFGVMVDVNVMEANAGFDVARLPENVLRFYYGFEGFDKTETE